MKAQSQEQELLSILADAKKKAEAGLKSGRSCRWANMLVIAAANAAKRCSECKEFYRGNARIEPNRLMAYELQKEGGVIRLMAAVREKAEELSLPNEEEAALLRCAMVILAIFVAEVRHFVSEFSLLLDTSLMFRGLKETIASARAGNRTALVKAFDDCLWQLAETAYQLSVAEYRIWFEHREWEITGYEDHPDGPCDVRGIFDNLYQELKRWDADNHEAFGLMRTALDGLSELRDDLPVAFVRGNSASNSAYLFAQAVRQTLTLPVRIFFENPVEAALDSDDTVSNCEPSAFLANMRIDFLNRLNELLQKRAKVAKDKTLRRMWYEAAAELMVRFSWGQPVFTAEQADRLIALADAAQRESWIQHRMASSGETENLPSAPPPVQKVEVRVGEDMTKAINELKAAFLAARPAPKPGTTGGKPKPPTNPRKGSGLHGTKTKKMDDQMSAFKAYLIGKPLTEKRNLGYWASNWWNQNEADCLAAAKATGENRGYASYVKLAGAYRSSAGKKKK